VIVGKGLGEPSGVHITFLDQGVQDALGLIRRPPIRQLPTDLLRRPFGPRAPVSYLRGDVQFNTHRAEANAGSAHHIAICKPSGTPGAPQNAPAMKAEINQRIAALLDNPEIEAVRVEVRTAFEVYRDAREKDVAAQREAFDKEDHPAPEPGEEPIRFTYTPDEEDERNDAMYKAFRDREKAWREKVAAEQRANLDQKQAILDKLKALVANEEHIGKMFDAFNALNEEWNAVGNVPGDQYRELHDNWHRLKDEFFYNVNIYKQLQEHDLQVNLKKKEDLIAQAGQLEAVTDLKEKEMLARSYMKAWFDIGPSPRETYQELADTFFGHTRAALDAVKAHYDGIREGFKKNLDAKLALVEEVRTLLEEDIQDASAWPAQAEKVKDVQKRWKMVGFAGRKDDQEAWEQFRGLCDLFFQKRDAAFADVRAAQSKVKERKQAIADEAAALADSQDWKVTSDKLIALQKEWKELGSAGPRDENKLWRKFRGACDQFFTARKAIYADRDKEHKANLKKKEALIGEIDAFELTGNHSEDLKTLKAFSTRWAESGHVPRRVFEQIVDRYRTAMDAKYDALGAKRSERSVEAYKNRVDSLVKGEGAEHMARKEERMMREKMDRLRKRVAQYENNMGIFTGKGAASIMADLQKKIEADKREMDEIRKKLKMLREARQANSEG